MAASSSTPQANAFAGFLRQHGVKLVVSALITVGMVGGLRKGGLAFLPGWVAFEGVRWWTLPIYLGTLLGVSWFRAVRWRYLLRPFAEVPTKKLLAVSWIGFAAILLMPFRIGEFVRPYMVRSRGRVDANGRTVEAITMTAATGTVVGERVIDAVYLSVVLVLALVFVPTIQPLPEKVVGIPIAVEKVRWFGYVMFGVFSTAFAVIAVFYAARDFAHQATLAVFGLVSRSLGEKLATMAERFADGLRFLGRKRDAIPFLLETTAYWALNALGMWVLLWGCGVVHPDGSPPTFGEACALMGVLGIAILIPGPPGLLGPFQAGIYAGMTMYYGTSVVTTQGAAYVFLIYVIQFAWTVVSAAIFLIGHPDTWRALEEAEGALPPTEPPAAQSRATDEKLATPSA